MTKDEPFEYFAKVTFGIICFIWFLATLFCTPVGRWIRRQDPWGQRPFYYDPGRRSNESSENGDGAGRRGEEEGRRAIEANPAIEVWPVGRRRDDDDESDSGSSTNAEFEYNFRRFW